MDKMDYLNIYVNLFCPIVYLPWGILRLSEKSSDLYYKFPKDRGISCTRTKFVKIKKVVTQNNSSTTVPLH